ncbi:hypothetical protein PoB_002469300 [Plakobranchus ocellatus]|uniref:Uncharacterized protein n=1 Tax=Plakobranchus ocellatus TaxID=259542 RepID=A0AAV3ZUS8_9GAST|nr:hypothetical protein PoB_002469300 [Plakobranchus ocellatus]
MKRERGSRMLRRQQRCPDPLKVAELRDVLQSIENSGNNSNNSDIGNNSSDHVSNLILGTRTSKTLVLPPQPPPPPPPPLPTTTTSTRTT